MNTVYYRIICNLHWYHNEYSEHYYRIISVVIKGDQVLDNKYAAIEYSMLSSMHWILSICCDNKYAAIE